jgi:hypothetical protein
MYAHLVPAARQVVISDESPLVNVRLDDPVLQDVYSATVVGIRPAAHHTAVSVGNSGVWLWHSADAIHAACPNLNRIL